MLLLNRITHGWIVTDSTGRLLRGVCVHVCVCVCVYVCVCVRVCVSGLDVAIRNQTLNSC